MDERQRIVLIAAGEPESRAALRETLLSDRAARYSVVEAETGARALELRRERSPDCLILDQDLPDLSGLDALKQLAAEDGLLACAVVVLVPAGATRLAVEAMKSGAHECLEKDRARGDELRRAVNQAIEKADHQRQVRKGRETVEKNRELEAGLAASERKQGEEARRGARAGVSAGGAVVSHPEIANQKRFEEKLRLLKTAIEQSTESVTITTAQLDLPGPQIVYVNPAFTKMTGYTPEEVIGKTPRILQGPKTDRAVLDRLRKNCEEGRGFFGEAINYRKDGSEFYIEWSVGPVRNERGEVTHFVATQREVTERRRVEEELRRSEEEFRSLFDLSAIGMAQVSPSGQYLHVNRRLCQMLGYSEQEMLQLTLHDVTHPDDREFSAARLDSSFTGRPDEYSIEKRYVRKDGAIIWVLINWEVIRDSRGQPMHTVANVQDITARRRAEEALRANEAQLRAILDNSTAVIFVKDIEGRYLRINRWYEVIRGLTEAEVKGKTDYDLYPKETSDTVRANDQEVIAANTPLQFEEQVALADGLHHFIAVKFPLHDDSGRPYAICGIATDITERKQAEEALKASEERLDLAMQAGDIGTFDWDVRTNVVIWTEKNKAIFGVPSSTTTGMFQRWRERVHPEDLPRCEASIQETFEKKLQDWRAQYRMIRADTAEERWIDSRSRIFYDAQGAPLRMIGTNIDITERKQGEEALKAREEQFRSLIEQASDGIFVANLEGTYTEVNTSACHMLGYSREELIGKKVSDLLPPEDFPRLDALRESLLKGNRHLGEWRLRRKDGQYLPVELSTKIFPDGRWHAIVRDIHNRKQAEAEREELLAREQAAREAAEAANRSKDEFLAVVSHELRSPLNAMLGYARLLRYGPLDAQKVKQAVEIIERNGKAQSLLIDDLLDTARIISGKLKLDVEPVDLVAVIREAIQTIYPAADAKDIALQADIAPEVGQITGDPVRLQQLVWNLLSNAVKFTPAGGRVEVRLERIDPHVCIIVSDTGKGISPDFMPYIFDRFRQADASSVRRYGGLGLGLALVKYLVELHGGTIEATSAGDDQGATFKVLLPVRAVSSPLGETEGAPVTISGLEEATLLAGVRALVVDDETDARELVKSVLAQYGADVVAASSATEAYELITAAPARERPDVMVTDLGMPDEDGFSLLRRVREWERERNLYIPAVALTAYGRVEDRVRALRAGFQTHVAKPVEPAELAVVIASLVRRPGRGAKT